MTVDYDAPRGAVAEPATDSIEELATRRDDAKSASVDADDSADMFELPGADILDEELSVAVVPIQADEFRCARCFLVHHRTQRVTRASGDVCRDCA
jgi:hypothetical protein